MYLNKFFIKLIFILLKILNYSCNIDKENFYIKIDIDMYFFFNIIILNLIINMVFGRY